MRLLRALAAMWSRSVGAACLSALVALSVSTATLPSLAAANQSTPPRIVPERKSEGPGDQRPKARLSIPGGVHQFAGMGPCEAGFCWAPGEPVIAVGPSHIVQTVNAAATVYEKSTGNLLAEFDFGTFWGPSTTFCVDPRVIYLSAADRFAISCSDNTTSTSPVRFAISQTSDPTGAWYQYAAPNNFVLDQDKIEATSDKFVVAGNAGNTEAMYVYNLSDVVNGVPDPTVVTLTAVQSELYQAAVQQTPTSPAYFVSSYPGSPLLLATITGTPAAGNVTLEETPIPSEDYPGPHEPPVPGGFIGNGDLDGRVYDAIFEVEASDNKPVIQFSSARECGTQDCITSGRIDLSGPSPVLSYNNLIGELGWDYTYGAVGLNGNGDVFMVYSRSSTSVTPGMAVVGPGFGVTLQDAVAGTSSCSSGQSPPCDERWGDYLGTAIDPSDPASVWVSGLYQAADGPYGWRTIIAKVSMFGADDTGRIPSDAPKGPITTCEVRAAQSASKLVASILECHAGEASGKVVGDGAENGCEAAAIAKFTANPPSGCPTCLNVAALTAAVENIVDAQNAMVYCSSTGTPFGGDDSGNIPSDAPTGPVTKCQNGVAKAVGNLVGAIAKCTTAVVQGQATDDQACDAAALKKFGATKTAGCDACTNLPTIGSVVEIMVNNTNGLVYCGSPSGAFLD
jgi:hypothetical protein